MTHARDGLAWLAIAGLVVLIIGACWPSPEVPAPASRCPADCRLRLTRGRAEICTQFRIEVVSGPTCPLHDRPAR